MKNRVSIILPGLAIAALSACSSSSSEGTSTRQFADTAGTAAVALEDGKVLSAQEGGSAAVSLNYATGETSLTDASFKLRKNSDGELTYTVNGVEKAFKPTDRLVEADGKVYGYNVQNGGDGNVFTSLFSYQGELDATLDTANPNYLQVWGYQTNEVNAAAPGQGGEPNLKGFAVVGTETRTSTLSGIPTATYTGRARIDGVPDTGFVDNGTSRARNRADLTMTADFGAGTMSGAMNNITYEPPGGVIIPLAGSIAMNSSTISGNSYSGTLTPDAAYTADTGVTLDASSRYSGAFYGPAADQTGGTLSLSGTDGGGSGFNGVGYFSADKN